MKFERSSGILLHPTSLPGPYGAGEIGPSAIRWLDFLSESGCGLWQVLPLGPTGYGDSPYQSFSAFGGNPYLISFEWLMEEGFLSPDDLSSLPDFPEKSVDYGEMIPWKISLLDKAFRKFQATPSSIRVELERFRVEQSYWLEDFALFMAIKEYRGGGSWAYWPKPLRKREADAVGLAKQALKEAVDRFVFQQFLFFRQWKRVKEHAHKLGIKIIGDIPIFVAHDSADVWANLDLFYMDPNGSPTVVAGVPPDYFSPTGQLWGNPIYKWDVHKSLGYQWWINRFKAVLQLVDIVRLDHFRGFAGYWEVPAGNPTAEFGRWVPGPGNHFLQAIERGLGELPIIAEDLGVITPDVVELRDAFDLPGMKVLQFAFLTSPADVFLPHNYTRNCVVYTGTHDNDTAVGWFKNATAKEKRFA
ncbi:MAG: 4-alpha-glucanotransferase, partial [Chloroflexi bacterium]